MKKGLGSSVVEQRTENPCVGGSIPPRATFSFIFPLLLKVFSFSFLLLSFPLSIKGNVLFEDFETSKNNKWISKGKAFRSLSSPAGIGAFSGRISGYANESFLSSSQPNSKATGKIQSSSFVIKEPYIGFLLCGSNSESTAIQLVSEKGEILFKTSGKNNLKMQSYFWDVRKWKNKKFHIEIIDYSQDNFGVIFVDHIVFCKEKKFLFPFGTLNKNPLPPNLREDGKYTQIQALPKTKLRVFANHKENQVISPTSLSTNPKGEIYLAETHRFTGGKGIDDNNERHFWILEDIANQTTNDRLKMYQRWYHRIPEDYYTKYSEKIRILKDENKDGKADFSSVFAEKFNAPLDGTASGILSLNENIYFACIPHIWLLKDNDGDFLADERKSLQEGFGVRVSFSGHDLNGFILAHDGRIYCTVGDRGFNFITKEGKHYSFPDQGAVLRFEQDGSNLEVIHTGLRNPKEISFDKYGNFFTVDNNSDQGDQARLVYVAEGGDSGWRMGYQTLATFYKQIGLKERPINAWMEEKMWQSKNSKQPAYILPPIANITRGPSGMDYYPGTGFFPHQEDHFLICDYQGNPKRSGIWSFSVAKEGAGMRLASFFPFLLGIAATDVEYSFDGKIYLTDFIGGWQTQEGGKVWALESKNLSENFHERMQKNLKEKSPKKLINLLSHPDRRIRLYAQHKLTQIDRGFEFLRKSLQESKNELQSLHSLWGISILARKEKSRDASLEIIKSLYHKNPEIRAQAARYSSDALFTNKKRLIELLEDSSPRVRYFSAICLGKIQEKEAFLPLLRMIAQNNDEDSYLRHAGVMGIYGCASPEQLASLYQNTNASIRLSAVLALRKHRSEKLSFFLKEKNQKILGETIRAIHDEGIQEAQKMLPSLLDGENLFSEMQFRRLLFSTFKFENATNLEKIINFSLNLKYPIGQRKDAVRLLREWETPFPVDQSTGIWMPLQERNSSLVRKKLEERKEEFLQRRDEILGEFIQTASFYSIKLPHETLSKLLKEEIKISSKISIMQFFLEKNPILFESLFLEILQSKNKEVAFSFLESPFDENKSLSLSLLKKMMQYENIEVQKRGYNLLGKQTSLESLKMIEETFRQIQKGGFEEEIIPNFLASLEENPNPKVKKLLKAYKKGREEISEVWEIALYGGKAKEGKKIFYEHGKARCVRCHGEAEGHSTQDLSGPSLKNIGNRSKEYLLESLLYPSKKIAQGFGFPPSSMPSMKKILTPEEIQNLIAYLRTLKNIDF